MSIASKLTSSLSALALTIIASAAHAEFIEDPGLPPDGDPAIGGEFPEGGFPETELPGSEIPVVEIPVDETPYPSDPVFVTTGLEEPVLNPEEQPVCIECSIPEQTPTAAPVPEMAPQPVATRDRRNFDEGLSPIDSVRRQVLVTANDKPVAVPDNGCFHGLMSETNFCKNWVASQGITLPAKVEPVSAKAQG